MRWGVARKRPGWIPSCLPSRPSMESGSMWRCVSFLFDGDRIDFSTGFFQKQRFSFFCFQYGIAGHMVAAALSTLAEGLQEAAVDYAEAQAKLASSAAGLFQRVGANVGRLAEDLLEKSVAPEGSVS